jgi:hypothetical protein
VPKAALATTATYEMGQVGRWERPASGSFAQGPTFVL